MGLELEEASVVITSMPKLANEKSGINYFPSFFSGNRL